MCFTECLLKSWGCLPWKRWKNTTEWWPARRGWKRWRSEEGTSWCLGRTLYELHFHCSVTTSHTYQPNHMNEIYTIYRIHYFKVYSYSYWTRRSPNDWGTSTGTVCRLSWWTTYMVKQCIMSVCHCAKVIYQLCTCSVMW